MTEPLAPGARIGILGGGQLGRMLSMAAARLGFACHIFEPGENPPAGQVAWRVTRAGYDDLAALEGFARSVDIITYEFENIPTSALDLLEGLRPIRPGREALRISQDRLTEKEFLAGLGLKVAPYAPVCDATTLAEAVKKVGIPAILKTRRFGYDGKGQMRVFAPGEAGKALAAMEGAEAILEGFVDFSHEVSVIAARGAGGEISAYDPGENLHVDGILATTTVPARLSRQQHDDAILLAANILKELDYIGVIGVELFVTPDGLTVNEIAPRVHNSGHWTQDGCVTDQFEQHIRAIVGWPLGDGTRIADVTMENLIGTEVERTGEIARDPTAALHLYGKAETRPGRKMGHVNRVRARGRGADTPFTFAKILPPEA